MIASTKHTWLVNLLLFLAQQHTVLQCGEQNSEVRETASIMGSTTTVVRAGAVGVAATTQTPLDVQAIDAIVQEARAIAQARLQSFAPDWNFPDIFAEAQRAEPGTDLYEALQAYKLTAENNQLELSALEQEGAALQEEAAVLSSSMLVIGIIVMVAFMTMPYWLPLIYQQSGMANDTLYEAYAHIDFQGSVGTSCDRANFHLYPYSRKDLGGSSWQEVGGDRGRTCLPEQYETTITLLYKGVKFAIESRKKATEKKMYAFSVHVPQQKNAPIEIVWKGK